MSDVVEVTVFTLEELQAKGGKPYERALQNVKEWDTTGDWCQWMTQDINEWFKQEAPSKAEANKPEDDPNIHYPVYTPFDSGTCQEWDAEYRYCNFDFEVDLADYMQRNDLHLKYRKLYKWLRETGSYTIAGKVRKGYNRNAVFSPLDDDIDRDVEYDIRWCGEFDEAAQAKMNDQVGEVMKVLAGDAKRVQIKLGNWVHDEWMWRYSDEFAHQEAEALEMRFTQCGSIFSTYGLAYC